MSYISIDFAFLIDELNRLCVPNLRIPFFSAQQQNQFIMSTKTINRTVIMITGEMVGNRNAWKEFGRALKREYIFFSVKKKRKKNKKKTIVSC